jgi:CRP-like cAMP-binding protein
MTQNFFQDLMTLFQTDGIAKSLVKDELLLKEGQVENSLYLIESGAVRVFLLSELEETNIRFGYSGSMINSLASFLRQAPSEFYIEALRKTEIRILSRTQILRFYSSKSSASRRLHCIH